MSGNRCRLVDGADVIVHALPLNDEGDDLLGKLRETSPDMPLCIHVTGTNDASTIEHHEIIGPPLTPAHLRQAVSEALSRMMRTPPPA